MGIESSCSFNNFAESLELVTTDGYGNPLPEPLLRIRAEAGYFRLDLTVSRLLEELVSEVPEQVESAVSNWRARTAQAGADGVEEG